MFKFSAIIKSDCDISSPLSPSLFMKAVQSSRALEVLMNEGRWGGEVLGGGVGRGGRRGAGGVAPMVAHLLAPHPSELGMTHFWGALASLPHQINPTRLQPTHTLTHPQPIQILLTRLSAPCKFPGWITSSALLTLLCIKVSFVSCHCLFCHSCRQS